ncbi:hypothetical protein [Neobacillus mesonae]|uniref:hypothetical protein n=1 Tax=Neobacillus mesonae TaxID=1193713 RepID=UPI002E225EE3|nr:hypothetical protein [Neobacillus mesonae]
MTLILPILILLLILGSFVGLTSRMGKKVHRRGNISYSSRVRLIFSGYLAVLIICMVISIVLPVKGMTTLQKVNSDELVQEGTSFYDAAKAGDTAKLDSKYLSKEWKFDFQGRQLKMTSYGDNFYNITVIVERKDQNDGVIEASFYKTGADLNGLDISKFVHPPQLRLMDGELIISNSPKNKLKFAQFENPFPSKQFTGGSIFGHESNSSEGTSILYMKIPKNLTLNETDNINLEYVGEGIED